MKKVISIMTGIFMFLSAQVCFADSNAVYMVIDSSRNFDGQYIETKKQIKALPEKTLSVSDGEKVTAYIRVNDDGKYSIVRIEE
jgi:hypothetical protein